MQVAAAGGHLDPQPGRACVARNDTWGQMRTRWAFTVTNGKISRFETGQA
jgi:hypothetical protein